MIPVKDISKFDFESVDIDPFWNVGSEKEFKMHRIHAYPAKFPAFITTKALEYANTQGYGVTKIADVFCGCGTSAFEAKRNDIDFWGCDINPVATLITKVKSRQYQKTKLEDYLAAILKFYRENPIIECYSTAPERLQYWYRDRQFNELAHLKHAIINSTPIDSDYRLFFFCAFSNILKPTSVWLTKSIKPQVDPLKQPADVISSFESQCDFMMAANQEIDNLGDANSEIITASFLASEVQAPKVDMIITSPPYVTSYEYADLHQLSSLWLDYVDDFRELREGAIGSLYHDYNFNRELKRLNNTGTKIVTWLLDQYKPKARSVAKYFLDMQKVAKKSADMLNSNGLAIFVIGNTEYKGVRIDNAKHLAESMMDAGFREISVTKRKISKKILTPYRDERGKFTTNAGGRKVYSEEFILLGRK
ncbi:hypothetical protein ACH50O_00710 [Methylomonas sp. 2BW1-5-20]|uniref:hypothetical protein n=1 Tax=Methylomonas sp. 2BW1-5-20 TaxID=3376686 RepID=UPI00405140E9